MYFKYPKLAGQSLSYGGPILFYFLPERCGKIMWNIVCIADRVFSLFWGSANCHIDGLICPFDSLWKGIAIVESLDYVIFLHFEKS